jgi:dipeptidyl aminopeptidase/acylaminoacyl peptidase
VLGYTPRGHDGGNPLSLIRLVAVIACAAATATFHAAVADGAAAPAATEVKNGNIMFAGRDTINGGWYVWQVAPRSPIDSRVSTWIDGPQGANGPGASWARYSPDGTRAAYVYASDIVVRDVASGTVLQVVEGMGLAAGAGLDWSPDGTKLVLCQQRHLRILDLVSEAQTTIFARPNTDMMLRDVSWSSNGRWVAFRVDYENVRSIRAVRPDGSGLHAIVRGQLGGEDFVSPEWSPDSSRLAFIRAYYDALTGTHTTTLETIDKTGDGPIVNVSGLAGGPAAGHWFTDLAWSPDGKKIAAIDFYRSAPAVDVGQVRAYAATGASRYWLTSLQRIDENGTLDWGRKLP